MSRYVEFELPDGSKVIIESDEPGSGRVQATRGIGDLKQAAETFENAAENARKAGLVILDKVRGLHDSPDEVEITFGLKASGELGSLVIAKAGVEASYSVKLTWKRAETKKNVPQSLGLRYSGLRRGR
jgi:hypothetical protein